MVPDPRIERKKVYPLDFLLLIVFLSTLSGNASWYEVENYAEEYEEEAFDPSGKDERQIRRK